MTRGNFDLDAQSEDFKRGYMVALNRVQWRITYPDFCEHPDDAPCDLCFFIRYVNVQHPNPVATCAECGKELSFGAAFPTNLSDTYACGPDCVGRVNERFGQGSLC